MIDCTQRHVAIGAGAGACQIEANHDIKYTCATLQSSTDGVLSHVFHSTYPPTAGRFRGSRGATLYSRKVVLMITRRFLNVLGV